MSREEALEKIKKLLRMKRGGTAGEVENALAAAQKIAAEHGIDLNSVDPDAKDDPIGHEDTIIGARIQFECKYASLVCQSFFNVSVFTRRASWTKYALTFVGTEWDRQIAIYVYHFLVGHFRREWNTRRGRCRNRQSFLWGMYCGLCSKLREQMPDAGIYTLVKDGVVVIDPKQRALQRRKDYIAENFGEMESKSTAPDRDSETAKYRGWVAGRETNIRKGVNGAPAARERIDAPRPALPAPPAGQMQLL